MFLDSLSQSLLYICDTNHLSYEAASERCSLSARHFGDIARGQATPSVVTLEKLCFAFEITPNALLGVSDSGQLLTYCSSPTVRLRNRERPPVCWVCGGEARRGPICDVCPLRGSPQAQWHGQAHTCHQQKAGSPL